MSALLPGAAVSTDGNCYCHCRFFFISVVAAASVVVSTVVTAADGVGGAIAAQELN